MEGIGGYILSIIAVTMIIGILSSLASSNGLLKPVGGVVLLVVMLQPVVHFDLGALEGYWEQTFTEGESAAEEGSAMAEKAIGEIIKSETEAYILDKAKSYRAEINVEVELRADEIPCPVEVTIYGTYDSVAKAELQNMIETELGIPKERQKWNGAH